MDNYNVFYFNLTYEDVQEVARDMIGRELTAQEMRTIEDGLERFFDFNQF